MAVSPEAFHSPLIFSAQLANVAEKDKKAHTPLELEIAIVNKMFAVAKHLHQLVSNNASVIEKEWGNIGFADCPIEFTQCCETFKNVALRYYETTRQRYDEIDKQKFEQERASFKTFVVDINASKLLRLQTEWMILQLGDFQPDDIVVTFGGFERTKKPAESFQTYPKYARELAEKGKKVLIISLDFLLQREQTQVSKDTHLFCFTGDFMYAGALTPYLLRNIKKANIFFHSYYLGHQSPLSIRWVDNFYTATSEGTPKRDTVMTVLSGYFNDCLNFKLIDYTQRCNKQFEEYQFANGTCCMETAPSGAATDRLYGMDFFNANGGKELAALRSIGWEPLPRNDRLTLESLGVRTRHDMGLR